jgi:DNA polymerase delta subunit 3
MLFEFHRVQNGKKPGSIHAVYMIAGQKREQAQNISNGDHIKKEDAYMQSSPPEKPSLSQPRVVEDIPILSITIAREEDIEKAKTQFESISSIHVYSLGPSVIKDMEVLTDCNRQIIEQYNDRDPLEVNHIYGTIINKNVKRRTVKRAPAPAVAAPAVAKPKAIPSRTQEAKVPTPSSSAKAPPKLSSQASSGSSKDFFGKPSVPRQASNLSAKDAPTSSAPAAKPKTNTIGGMFASSKSKASPSPATSAAATPAADSPMAGVADDDSEDDEPAAVAQPSKDEIEKSRQARKEREAKLAQMMEESDEEVAPTPEVESQEKEEEEEPEPAPEENKEPEGKREFVETSNGRRRGRRRVMKKKTVKDEEGYLGKCFNYSRY